MRTVTAPTKFVTDSLVIVSKLQEVLRQWNESIKKDILFPPTLAYQLDGHYTEANLSWSTLKLQDRLIVSHLRGACEPLDISLFISTFERNSEERVGRRKGQDANIEPTDLLRIRWISEESKEILILHKVQCLSGNIIAENLEYDEADFIDLNLLGLTGNKSVQSFHSHYRAV
jgi:hypothetical protein